MTLPPIPTIRTKVIFFVCILFYGCSQSGQIEIDSIRITQFDHHPTLSDHNRKLITVDDSDKIIDELEIYPDTGAGCDSFLFDSGVKYILVDCNGQWIGIDKKTGHLNNEGWKWQEKLPANQIGKFTWNDKEVNYVFTKVTGLVSSQVYKYKDPR